jgi:cellulose synthase (UDP-forming)
MGVYDPERLGASASLAIEHLYVDWNALEAASLAAALREAAERGRWPLLTIEPWPRPSDDPEALLGDIVAGEYDQAMRALCRVIGDFARPVFVRWGHEMEHVTGRYPWARNDPTAYVSAYRRVVDTCRRVTRNVFYVWSPAGNPGLEPYWPGRPYADWVGVSVFGFPAWDLAHVGKLRTFAEIFAEKYARVERFDRPVMIAELGVTGGESHQKRWMRDVGEGARGFPRLGAVVYFNAADAPGAWPPEFGIPDWRIDLPGALHASGTPGAPSAHGDTD